MKTEIRVIRGRAEFAAIAEDWNDLVARSTLNNVFYRHEWFQTWLEHLAPPGELCVVTLAHRDRLVAAAPLQIVAERRKTLPLKVLTFLQSGITPRSGLLVEADDLVDDLLRAIDDLPGWHAAEFKSLELEHTTTRRFVAQLARRGPLVVEAGMVSPYEELPDSWEAYYRSRTNKFRQRFRSATNRMQQAGTVEVLRIETSGELERHFDSLVTVSAASWKSDEGTDMMTMERTASFYRDLSRRLAGTGSWIVYLLRLEEKPVAFMYILRDAGHWVALRSDYDEAYAYHMPGVYLHKEVIADLTTRPAPRIYDLVGWSTSFKSSLARSGRPLCDVTIARRNLHGRLLMLGKRAIGRRSPRQHLPIDQVIAGTVPAISAADDEQRDPGPRPGPA
jgi:CelD/BcsL family acetyltransferase involved in cellulose biosynthesis